MPRMAVFTLFLLSAACAPALPWEPAPSGETSTCGGGAWFDPTLSTRDSYIGTWLSFPWPADFRRTASGTVTLSDFPDPDINETLGLFMEWGESHLRGFGTNSPAFFHFDAPIDVTALPADAAAFQQPEAPLQLVDITPGSPERGARWPLRWEYRPADQKYAPGPVLAFAPAWGFPLRENRTYAALVTRTLTSADGCALRAPPLLRRLLGEQVADSDIQPAVPAALLATLLEQFAPLRDTLDAAERATLAAATVFTTQDVLGELRLVREDIHAAAAPAFAADPWRVLGSNGAYHRAEAFRAYASSWNSTAYHVYQGAFRSPNYERGTPPYSSAGGDFNIVDGRAVPVVTEDLRFVLTVPAAAPRGGQTCHPIVEVAHGTGGDAYSFVDDGTAGRLAARGLAGIGLDQPLSGDRGTWPELAFNYFNPGAGRTVLRQAAADTFALTRFIRETLVIPAGVSATGAEICFDTARLGFFGHSQGGITGSLAAPFETDITTWMISGAGGGMSITLVEGNGDVVPAALVQRALDMPADEVLTDLHPVVALVQMIGEAADPLNYSPSFLAPPAGAPRSLLLTSGLEDIYTPARTATALAVAGRIPGVGPLARAIPEYDWLDLPVVTSPVTGNAASATAGFLQLGPPGDASHFIVFHRAEAIHASMHFLESGAFDAAAVIERDPASDAL